MSALTSLLNQPVRGFVMTPTGTLWPHGEFSVGFFREYIEGYDAAARRSPEPDEVSDVDQDVAEKGAAGSPPLDLTNTPNSRKRANRGHAGITGYGKKMLKAGAYVAEREITRKAFTFLTITMPNGSRESRRGVVEHWAVFVNRLTEMIRRRQVKAGVPEWVFSASEVQCRRLERTGEGYLHLHACFPNWKGRKGSWILSPNEIRDWASGFWSKRVPEIAEGHINVDVKRVTKSVGRYLSKYLSKGSTSQADLIADWGEGHHLATWWNMSADLKEEVKRRIRKSEATGYFLLRLIQRVMEGQAGRCVDYIQSVTMEYDGAWYEVGWVGALSEVFLNTDAAEGLTGPV